LITVALDEAGPYKNLQYFANTCDACNKVQSFPFQQKSESNETASPRHPLIIPPSAQERSNVAKTVVNVSIREAYSTNKEPAQKPAAALEEADELENLSSRGPNANHTL
jgi:hypothetical protein